MALAGAVKDKRQTIAHAFLKAEFIFVPFEQTWAQRLSLWQYAEGYVTPRTVISTPLSAKNNNDADDCQHYSDSAEDRCHYRGGGSDADPKEKLCVLVIFGAIGQFRSPLA